MSLPSLDKRIAALLLLAWLAGSMPAFAAEKEDGPVPVPVTEEDRALAAKVRAAVKAAKESPGREMASMILYEWGGGLITMLEGKEAPSAEALKRARGFAAYSLPILKKGPGWPVDENVVVPRAKTAPLLDGRIDTGEWDGAFRSDGVFAFNEKERLESPATTWRMMRDDRYLYFAFACEDKTIHAPALERDGDVWRHDCVEMFILSDTDNLRYWELVVGPDGCVFDALHQKKRKGWGSTSDVSAQIDGLKGGARCEDGAGYAVELAVPWSSLPGYENGRTPAVGQTFRLMLARLDKTKDTQNCYAFRPLLNWGHNVWNHARVRLAE